MKQVKIFSAFDVIALQFEVNEWLTVNRNIDIHETNMNSFGTPDPLNGKDILGNEKHTFYIFYSITPHPITEAAAVLENALPATEEMPNMNTDVLPHAN